MQNFLGSWFLVWHFQGVSHSFTEFSRVKLCFWNFQEYSDKSKNSYFFWNNPLHHQEGHWCKVEKGKNHEWSPDELGY